jgi:hypothetical protein
LPTTPAQQPARYPDAEVRGRLRVWKEQLARHYQQFDRAYRNRRTLHPTIDDMVKHNSLIGLRRAFAKLSGRGASYLAPPP